MRLLLNRVFIKPRTGQASKASAEGVLGLLPRVADSSWAGEGLTGAASYAGTKRRARREHVYSRRTASSLLSRRRLVLAGRPCQRIWIGASTGATRLEFDDVIARFGRATFLQIH